MGACSMQGMLGAKAVQGERSTFLSLLDSGPGGPETRVGSGRSGSNACCRAGSNGSKGSPSAPLRTAREGLSTYLMGNNSTLPEIVDRLPSTSLGPLACAALLCFPGTKRHWTARTVRTT